MYSGIGFTDIKYDRVRSLYERLGKPQSKFSQKESKQFLNAFSGTGLWKLK